MLIQGSNEKSGQPLLWYLFFALLFCLASASYYLNLTIFLYIICLISIGVLSFILQKHWRKNRRGQNQRALLLENGFTGICILDREQRCVGINRKGCQLLGYTEDQVEGTLLFDYTLGQQGQSVEVAEAIVQALQNENYQQIVQGELFTRDGGSFPASMSVHGYKHLDGHGGALLFFTQSSVVEQPGSKEELDQQADKRQIEDGQLAKQGTSATGDDSALLSFLTGMSHDLRTPLNSILGFAQILEQRERESGDGAEGGQILKSGRHLLRLITNIIDYAKIEAGELTLRPEPVSFQVLLQEVSDILGMQAEQRGVTLQTHLEGEQATSWVYGDHTKLRQALVSLAVQQVSWCKKGSMVVFTNVSKDARQLTFQLIDLSGGMPVHRILPFFDGGKSISREDEKMHELELEVAIAKRLIEEMDGSVQFEQLKEQGNGFTIQLPSWSEPVPEKTKETVRVEKKEPSSVEEKPTSEKDYIILYVEDDSANRQLVRSILKKNSNYTVLEAENGTKGVASALEHVPDCILMDMHLPDMDGTEVMKKIREHNATQDIPIIAVSGDVDGIEVENDLESGFIDYIRKPLNVAEFRRTIEKVLHQEQVN